MLPSVLYDILRRRNPKNMISSAALDPAFHVDNCSCSGEPLDELGHRVSRRGFECAASGKERAAETAT